jgi:peptidoglycan hydrolase-like protein with peptidoglycan-binding domain
MKSLFQIGQSIADSHRARSVPPMALLQAAILTVSLHGLAAAEGPIYAVQDALKREHFFAGERTGVLDPSTRSALQRFQTRHGLPDTGEIDTATLQALQSSPEESRPVIESQSPATKGSAPSEAVVEKDREFLRNLGAVETGSEQKMPAPSELSAASALPEPAPVANPAPTQAAAPVQPLQPAPNPAPAVDPEVVPPSQVQPTVTPPSPPDTSIQPSRETAVTRPQVAKSRSVEKPRPLARRKVEQPARAQSSDSPAHQQPELEPFRSAPPRRVEPRIPPASSRVVEIDNDPEPLDSGGVRIIRSTRTTTGPDGRTYTKTTTLPGAVAPTIRRAEPVEPPRKKAGFFDRLFQDD